MKIFNYLNEYPGFWNLEGNVYVLVGKYAIKFNEFFINHPNDPLTKKFKD